MPKRAATKELNHVNWDQADDDDESEVDSPKFASAEVMSKRAYKVGKRRLSGAPTGKSVFVNFPGFGSSTTTPNDAKATFSFLSNSNTSTFSNTNGISEQKQSVPTNKDECKETNSNNDEYLSKLKGLNETLLEWIQLHVGKNPTCILTPIFNDYEKFLKEIQSERHTKKQDEKSESTTTNANLATLSTSTPPKPFFSMGLFPSSTAETPKDDTTSQQQSKLLPVKKESSTPNIIPGLNPLGNPLLSKSSSSSIFSQSFSVGDNKTTSTLSFGSIPFSSGNPTPSQGSEENDKEDDPPKNVFEPVTEEGAVFSHRVKLFLKKKEDYVDNGVGTLYIKPVDKEGSKYQAIVRADTNIGNILLNIILKESMPSKRVGKNNVMIMCVLEVEKEFKPVPALLRVKTEADADNLLEQINKYKK